MSPLALASVTLHGVACAMALVHAYARRRSPDKADAYALALVWCAWFVAARAHDVTVRALPPPGPPLSRPLDLALLALAGALYFAWPALILGWIRWTFLRARTWPVVLLWLVAWGIPAAVYPAIRGTSWFQYAGAFHLAALVGEVVAIGQWVRRREPPRAWHVIALGAVPICAFPAIPFFASGEARAGYLIWVLRGLVGLHLWCIAVLGGDLWLSKSRGS